MKEEVTISITIVSLVLIFTIIGYCTNKKHNNKIHPANITNV